MCIRDRVTIEEVNYDECVRRANALAEATEHGVMVQDTAWDGYETVSYTHLNTLNHSLELMKQGGIAAGMKREETEEELIVTISIPKK